MSMVYNGGPAFPTAHKDVGMTLRDWFAGMALASAVHLARGSMTVDDMAQVMYRVADAMLKAREAENE